MNGKRTASTAMHKAMMRAREEALMSCMRFGMGQAMVNSGYRPDSRAIEEAVRRVVAASLDGRSAAPPHAVTVAPSAFGREDGAATLLRQHAIGQFYDACYQRLQQGG